jgi:hypothetical protein
VYRFYCRRFLNLRGHHAGAYVLAIVEALPKGSTDSRWAREISLELADCSRRVAFDFPLETAADRRNSIRKARLIADVATRFAEALEAEADLVAARRPRDRSTA